MFRVMISDTLTAHLVLDLESLTHTYEHIYDEFDLTSRERVNGAEIALACRTFLRAFDAKTPNDLR